MSAAGILDSSKRVPAHPMKPSGAPEHVPAHPMKPSGAPEHVPAHPMSVPGAPGRAPELPPIPVALFAGTTEGRELAQGLASVGIRARVFVATEYGEAVLPTMPSIEVQVGRLDELQMSAAVRGATVVIDATHPYAVEASRNIRAAAHDAGARYLRVRRPAEQIEEAPDVQAVDTAADAARELARTGERALITTGSKELACFTEVPDFAERLFVRILPMAPMVERARGLGFPASHIICMQGPFTRELNAAMMRQVGATCLVTKESGRAGGFEEKLAAARDVGARTIVIRRPPEAGETTAKDAGADDDSETVASPDEALMLLRRLLRESASGGQAVTG